MVLQGGRGESVLGVTFSERGQGTLRVGKGTREPGERAAHSVSFLDQEGGPAVHSPLGSVRQLWADYLLT